MAARFVVALGLVATINAFLPPITQRTTLSRLRVLDEPKEFDQQEAEDEFRRRRAAAEALESRENTVAKLNNLIRAGDDAAEDKGTPVHEAPWAVYPGLREVIHVHRPAFRYLFEEVVLRSENREYVHVLEGSRVGCVVTVLDTLKSGDSLFVLAHATERVRVDAAAGGAKPLVRFAETLEPLRDDEERGLDAHALAAWDDPLEFDGRWFLRGASKPAPDLFRAPAFPASAEDPALEGLETLLWRSLDDLAALIRRSRTSGDFELPAPLATLRPDLSPSYPAARRALRLSFSLATLLEFGRAGDRQALLEETSTKRRLAALLAAVDGQIRDLAAALRLERIRRELQ